MNKLSYEMQIDLTGKSVGPEKYITLVRSGDVHHICTIGGAKTVIVINQDRETEYLNIQIIE